MALFNKLFFPTASTSPPASSTLAAAKVESSTQTSSTASNKSNKKRNASSQSVYSKNYISQFPFDGAQVRVLLYRECDSRGRRLLFDSNALQKVEITRPARPKPLSPNRNLNGDSSSDATADNQQEKKPNPKLRTQNNKNHSDGLIEVNEEFGYKHCRPNSVDVSSIGEMIFGALAMSFRGTVFKVHWLQLPTRILCSQVFLSPVKFTKPHTPHATISPHRFSTPRHSISSDYGSVDGFSLNSFSMPPTINIGRHASEISSERSSWTTSPPLDGADELQSLSMNSNCSENGRVASSPRCSSAYSTGTDSGYSAFSRLGGGSSSGREASSSDQWSSSHLHSTFGSLGSVLPEQSAQQRRLSTDSSNLASSSDHVHCFSSDGIFQRRISRSIHTSFENESSVSDFIGFVSDNYLPLRPAGGGGGSEGTVSVDRHPNYCGNESHSNPEIAKRCDVARKSMASRRAKLGLAVCISMSESFEEEMEQFCNEHIALLESMLSRLRACIERAYISHRDFLQIMFQAWQQVQQWFSDLFTAPRISCPVWLNITTSGSKHSKGVAERFVKELCWLLSLADTKDTNFFMSTMLTAVLTHHLGWVSTVSALSNSSAFKRSEASTAAIDQRAKLLQVSHKHPYNALWAQLGDLYGALGMPPKLTRTIVYGTEKLSVERVLNVLTYFIRCGEVRRSAKREDFNKELLKSFDKCKKDDEPAENSLSNESTQSHCNLSRSSGLRRTQTCHQNLNTMSVKKCADSEDNYSSEKDAINTVKKNEIPNVYAFRDSRFVQQELRIGNYLMDTGIVKNTIKTTKAKAKGEEQIRLMVTTPDNVEVPMAMNTNSTTASLDDGALEAIELVTDEIDSRSRPLQSPNGRKSFLWKIVPSAIKDGLGWHNQQKQQNCVNSISPKLDQATVESSERKENNTAERENKSVLDHNASLSLSDLITQNSMGTSDRMTWGNGPVKEALSIEEQTHFDTCRQKLISPDHDKGQTKEKDVLFVLGDNEPLINLKKSTEDLIASMDGNNSDLEGQALCALHQRTHGILASTKKHHSGVKFNFETYPQIATNYMRSKNLVMSNQEGQYLLQNKQQQQQEQDLKGDLFLSISRAEHALTNSQSRSGSCMVCNSFLNSYQTPSNATELEFETDDEHSYATSTKHSAGGDLTTVNSATSVETLKSSANGCTEEELVSRQKIDAACDGISFKAQKVPDATEMSSQLIMLPVPGIKEFPQDEELPGDMKLRAGFIPSLFLNVNDHYVSDMVLQGTCACPDKWEINLREDLVVAARSASLISLSAENIAIVADMEKWDVRLVSSQIQNFPFAGGQSAPVGMSQLVSSMLETIQVMNSAGVSAYECLSFLENKLQEIYLQSEALAAFLLDTDFCPLSAVTSALSLSENDVPLLLSVASIHTPQISRKCGISFR